MIKNLLTSIKTNQYTPGQVALLTGLLALIIFGGLYLIDPSLIKKS